MGNCGFLRVDPSCDGLIQIATGSFGLIGVNTCCFLLIQVDSG